MRHRHPLRLLAPIGAALLLSLGAASGARADEKGSLKEKLQLCAGCHNLDGNSVIPQNPRLAGLNEEYLERQMADFKSGARKSVVMAAIVSTLDDKSIDQLADYFSEQKPAKGPAADEKLAAQGKAIYDEGIVGNAVPACSGCHNDDGSGTDKYPRLAGQHPAYVVDQMLRFKSGERANDAKSVMRAVAKRMNESEIKAVSEYVATLTGGGE